ncbi:MAG TPA: RsbRD N-terminal domain-containing protein, partial [Acidobacteriota bacterium]
MTNLTRLIETHSDELYDRWLKEVQENPDTPSFHNYPRLQMLGHIRAIYRNVQEMIDVDNREHLERIYTMLGADRFRQGFQLSEVLKALILARRVLWMYVENHGFYNALEMHQVMHFRHKILQFFDRAIFFVAKGYEREA